MGVLYTYNPAKVTLSIGDLTLDGYMDGVFFRCARDFDQYTKTTTTNGDTIINVVNMENGSITISLHDGTPANKDLDELSVPDADGNPKVVGFQMKDNSGGDTIKASKAWVRRPADDEKGGEASANEWIIDCHDLRYAREGLRTA